MTDNRQSNRVKESLQKSGLTCAFWGLLMTGSGLIRLIFDGTFPLFYLFPGCFLLFGGISISSKSKVKNLDTAGILLILTGICHISMTVYAISQTDSQTNSLSFVPGAGMVVSGFKILNTSKKFERLIEEGEKGEKYFLCPSCSFEQWSGYQDCQKCGHKFQN
jgi:uncharacterized membrane protein HdeD (DUF308 family)